MVRALCGYGGTTKTWKTVKHNGIWGKGSYRTLTFGKGRERKATVCPLTTGVCATTRNMLILGKKRSQ